MDIPALASYFIFATEPTDRALAGWSPFTVTECCEDEFAALYGPYLDGEDGEDGFPQDPVADDSQHARR